MDFEVVAFSRGYRRDALDCGNDELNEWLRTQAGQHERRNNTRTFQAVAHGEIIG